MAKNQPLGQQTAQPDNQASPQRRARKIIVLDHFGKRILNVVLSLLILSIFVPLIIFSFVQPTKLVDVALDKGVAYYKENVTAKVNSLTISYTYEDTTHITDVVFDNGVVSKKITTTKTDTTATIVVVRKLSTQDKDFIKANISGMAEATDDAIADYVKTATDYITITNTLTEGEWQVTSQELSTKTSLEVGGTTYKDYLVSLGFTETITSAQAKAQYNIFGLGYAYKDYVLTDDQGNILAFDNNYFDKLTLADGSVYDMTVNAVSYTNLGIKNI